MDGSIDISQDSVILRVIAPKVSNIVKKPNAPAIFVIWLGVAKNRLKREEGR